TKAAGRDVTDEAEAMELAGHAVQLVEGRPDNIKVTRSADLEQAEQIIAALGQ
ncbi:MAG: 2-C-methyl-D-erythritol 4-phosphate cytidylyltransferase, partial [Chromatiales bacterium]|nr:2-C-methyl-D-erythritol 4-phosphate cytidylyltransferase [Chromatiales bacterium]